MSHSLLTPSEARAFDGFLAAVDRHTPNSVEWVGYTPALAEQIPHKQGKEALARATKDLLSSSPANAPLSSKANTGRKRTGDGPDGRRPRPASAASSPSAASTGAAWPSYAPDPDTLPARRTRSRSRSRSRDRYSPYAPRPAHAGLALPPLTVPSRPRAAPASTSAPSLLPGPASQRSPPAIGGARDRPSPSGSDSSAAGKRPAAPPSASMPASVGVGAGARKRPPPPPAKKPAPPPAKPALLSAAEKRANHIQSEQKRRANIRRGYESLCDAVPALREAIQAEEAAGAQEDAGGRVRKRKRKGEEERLADGRAGPKSENVVLSKTIDYVRALRQEQQALQTRLTYARSILAPGHPALTPERSSVDAQGELLWEREWNGGHGAGTNEDDEDGGSEDDE